MFVEVIYGILSNSLGLLTDGAHMLLDCSAILIGLYSSYMSNKPKNKTYNFGYLRSEILGTFINSVFLVFIALYIVFESIERFLQPKIIKSDHLILIAFLGLLVNLIGIFFLHGHSHGEEGCSHTHSKVDSENHIHEHKHEHDHSHNHSGTYYYYYNLTSDYNENLYAIYIHILADALGSVSVLISSFLIKYYGLNFTDPICSLFISIMILYSSFPILKSSMCTLLHILPEKYEKIKVKIENEV